MTTGSWTTVREAIDFAWNHIQSDEDPLNEREQADGDRYLQFIVATASQYSLFSFSPEQPEFLPPIETSRWLGASGPDIDYDVAAVQPGVRHRISGNRGGSSYVGICIYANDASGDAKAIVMNVDVDHLVNEHGDFTYEFEHPEATRVIIRQYFHNRHTQQRGHWLIERAIPKSHLPSRLPSTAEVSGRLAMMANSILWNARLNQLWGADLRHSPNQVVLQSAEEIVAAVPNPDVTYAFGWWKLRADQRLHIHVNPPTPADGCHYWGLQVCDRWFQSHPDRAMNINDQNMTRNADGSVTLVLADTDPSHPNWIRTYGHTVGTMFFRWLHHTPSAPPTCQLVEIGLR